MVRVLIKNMNFEETERDLDQVQYQVYSNIEPFHEFLGAYSKILDEHRSEFEQLSVEMHEYFHRMKQPAEEFERKMQFCRDLKAAIQRNCPKWIFDVVPNGSTVTGLALRDSDLDIAIHIPQAREFFPLIGDDAHHIVTCDTRRASLKILQIIRRILENDDEIKWKIVHERPNNVQLVPAQVQILKIRTVDEIEAELSVVVVDFLSSMHNSFLLRHFVHIDDRFAPFCAVVKKWADRTKIKNPKDGGFNSYALVLLVIHFLQCGTSPPILPHFPLVYESTNFFAHNEDRFPPRLDFGAELPGPLPDVSKNPANLASLFFQFVHYILQFNFDRNYISIRDAMVKNRRTTTDQRVLAQKNKEVYIEDPFDDHNPGRTVRSIGYIKNILKETICLFLPKDGEEFKVPTLQELFEMDSFLIESMNETFTEIEEESEKGPIVERDDDRSENEEEEDMEF